MSKYKIFLAIVFLAFWVWSAINPHYRNAWLQENYLVFLFIPIILISGFYFKFSNVSYTLITMFMILHVIGAHYTYAEVPFGYTLQGWLHESRNMYDRLVHFSFGFLMAYPIREVFLRLTKVKGFWGFYLPFDVVLSLSGVYEIIEWLAVRTVSSAELSAAFLGAQGDGWDAQKDMLSAGIGALLAMLIIFVLNWIYNPNFGKELKLSFKIEKGDMPVGEERISQWLKRK